MTRATKAEQIAVDPARSVVVVACAGSGKTRLLVNRIVNLLKSGAKPGEILAVTFTRKAAAEIRGRVLRELKIQNNDNHRRILLAESPEDALTVSTFHGWFLSLRLLRPWSDARRDPPRVGDDNNSPLLREAWRNWLEKESDSDPARKLAAFMSPEATRKLMFQFAQNASAWRLLNEFNKGDGESDPDNGQKRLQDAESQLRIAAEEFASRAQGSGKVFDKARESARRFAAGESDHDDLRESFLTAKDAPRKRLAADNDGAAADICAALFAWLDAEETARALDFSRAATTAGAGFLRELDLAKARRHIAGFDDLEFSAWEALARPGADEGETLRHRLDCKYRHILVDEFQDTSPAQWQVLRAWLLDAHGSDESPSVFIVGDPRQSIYYWRGGDPRLLGAASQFLREHYGAAEVRLDVCRRCAPQILAAVNAVFGEAENFAPHKHDSNDSNSDDSNLADNNGMVEWKVFEKSASESGGAESAALPRDPLARKAGAGGDSARARWAEHIAETTDRILQTWRIDGARIRERDVLILLRQFTHAGVLLEKMAARNIRCAAGGSFLGAFECGDVLALASFLASPARDAPLARALKSPVFSLSDDALRDVALHESESEDGKKLTLWEKLQARSDVSPQAARAVELLTEWRELAEKAHLPAHDLLSQIYRRGNVVARYMASVPDVLRGRTRENLSALLDLALMMDGGRRPLLAQFLSGCERGEAADESSGAGDGVRVLTTHKAKGLEAEAVIVADANFSESESGGRGDSADILTDWPPERPAPLVLAARPRALPRAWRELAQRDAEAKQREDDNILYVAMTRAKRALFLFALGDTDKGPAGRFGLFEKLSSLPGAEGDVESGRAGCDFALGTESELESARKSEGFSPDLIPAGVELERSALERKTRREGEVRHQLLALLLAGFSPEEASRLLPAGTPEMDARLREARLVAESEELRALLNGAEVETEEDYADAGRRVFRPDLVVRKGGEVWVVDYKSGADSPERHREQLLRYARELGAQRAAILTAEGKLRELEF